MGGSSEKRLMRQFKACWSFNWTSLKSLRTWTQTFIRATKKPILVPGGGMGYCKVNDMHIKFFS